jgi:hypothetical protein
VGGVVSLSPVVEGLKRVEKGVDKTASELAIARLQKDIDDLQSQLNYLESKSDPEAILRGIGLIALGILISFLFWDMLGLILFSAIAGLLWIIWGIWSINGNKREKTDFMAKIEAKKAEITDHERVVNM